MNATLRNRLASLDNASSRVSGIELLRRKWAELAKQHPHLFKRGQA